MSYEFKNLNEVERLEAPTENTTVMGFEAGKAVQMPNSALYNPLYFDINYDTEIADATCALNYDPIYEALIIGRPVCLRQTYVDGETTRVMYELVSAWNIKNGEAFYLYTGAWWYDGLEFTNGSYHGATTE